MYKMFVLFLATILLGASLVNAVNLKVDSLEINGHTISSSSGTSLSQDYKRGDKLDIYVCVEALADVNDAQIYADITGYQYATNEPAKIHDMTDTFDLLNGHSDCFDLNLEVPTLIDKDYFKLRITSDDRNGTSVDNTYQLYLKGINKNNAVEIKDFTIDPQSVEAGRAFTARVQVKNLGDSKINDLKVTMSIPDLNIQTSDYMTSIDVDQSKTFEELLLKTDDCTKPGKYDVQFTLEYDNFQSTTTTGSVEIVASDACAATGADSGQSNTIVSVPNVQEISQGTSVVYPIMIKNAGGTSRTYALSVSGTSEWATTRMDPTSVIVVPAGQSKTVYLYVSTNKDAELGDKAFTLSIEDGTDTKSTPLVAKITKNANSDASGLRQALEIGIVILVVILIIVGLIIGFNKMRENKHETEPYY
jgi:uncharacterized membrane protein